MKLSANDKILFSWFQHEENIEGTLLISFILKTIHSFWGGFYRSQTQKPKEEDSFNLESLYPLIYILPFLFLLFGMQVQILKGISRNRSFNNVCAHAYVYHNCVFVSLQTHMCDWPHVCVNNSLYAVLARSKLVAIHALVFFKNNWIWFKLQVVLLIMSLISWFLLMSLQSLWFLQLKAPTIQR